MADLVPARGPLTTYLVTRLRQALLELSPPVGLGDGIAPAPDPNDPDPEHIWGWPSGQPGKGVFNPYVVLKTGPATPQRGPDSITGQPDLWQIPFTMTGWGAMREQADYAADSATKIAATISHREINALDPPLVDGFGFQLVQVAALGTTDRSDQTNPPMWQRSDSLTVFLGRARSRRGG